MEKIRDHVTLRIFSFLQQKCFHLNDSSSLVVLKVVKMTTSGAVNDENFIIMTKFALQCCLLLHEVTHRHEWLADLVHLFTPFFWQHPSEIWTHLTFAFESCSVRLFLPSEINCWNPIEHFHTIKKIQHSILTNLTAHNNSKPIVIWANFVVISLICNNHITIWMRNGKFLSNFKYWWKIICEKGCRWWMLCCDRDLLIDRVFIGTPSTAIHLSPSLSALSCKRSYGQISTFPKLWDTGLEIFNPFEIWHMSPQQCCRDTCKISKGCPNFNTIFWLQDCMAFYGKRCCLVNGGSVLVAIAISHPGWIGRSHDK